MTNVGVHVTHCCAAHGCKYGDADCPVALLKHVQAVPCEMCWSDGGETVQFGVQFRDVPTGTWFSQRGDWYPEVALAVREYLRLLPELEPPVRMRIAERRISPERGFADTGEWP